LFIDYGQASEKEEWKSCEEICRYLDVKPFKIDFESIGELWDKLRSNRKRYPFFPFRNLIFASLGAFYGYHIGVLDVALGIIKSSAPFPDCTSEFCDKLQAALTESVSNPINIHAPLITMDKSDVVRYGSSHNFPYELTYSCYVGRKKHCHKCPACIAREKAFKKVGITDPTPYED